MYDLLKCSNIYRISNPKGKDRENGTGAIFKAIMAKNIFSNVMKCINPHIKEVQQGYKQTKLHLHTSQ